jgi:hypothetical protein
MRHQALGRRKHHESVARIRCCHGVGDYLHALLALSKAESVEGLDKFMGVLMHAIPVGELAPTFAPLGNMTGYELKGQDGRGTRSFH